MDFLGQHLSTIAELTLAAATLASAIAVLYLRSNYVVRKEYEKRDAELQARLATADLKMQAIELRLPPAGETQNLTVAMTRLEGTLAALRERVDGMGDLLERVDATVTRQESYIHELKGT